VTTQLTCCFNILCANYFSSQWRQNDERRRRSDRNIAKICLAQFLNRNVHRHVLLDTIYRVFTGCGCSRHSSWPSSCHSSFWDRAADRTCKTLVFFKKSILHCVLRSRRLLKQFTNETSMSSWDTWFHQLTARWEKKCRRVRR